MARTFYQICKRSSLENVWHCSNELHTEEKALEELDRLEKQAKRSLNTKQVKRYEFTHILRVYKTAGYYIEYFAKELYFEGE